MCYSASCCYYDRTGHVVITRSHLIIHNNTLLYKYHTRLHPEVQLTCTHTMCTSKQVSVHPGSCMHVNPVSTSSTPPPPPAERTHMKREVFGSAAALRRCRFHETETSSGEVSGKAHVTFSNFSCRSAVVSLVTQLPPAAANTLTPSQATYWWQQRPQLEQRGTSYLFCSNVFLIVLGLWCSTWGPRTTRGPQYHLLLWT